jgi:hypothetical protein
VTQAVVNKNAQLRKNTAVLRKLLSTVSIEKATNLETGELKKSAVMYSKLKWNK